MREGYAIFVVLEASILAATTTHAQTPAPRPRMVVERPALTGEYAMEVDADSLPDAERAGEWVIGAESRWVT